MKKFTDFYIKNLKPQEREYLVTENDGFVVKVRPGGRKTFYIVYHVDGRKRMFKLGTYPATSLAAAKAAHAKAFAEIAGGTDPQQKEQNRKNEVRSAPTVNDLAYEYIERHAKVFKKSWQADERIINRYVLPSIGRLKLKDVKKRDIVLLLEKITDRDAPGMANNTFQVVRKMFNFAVERDLLEYTPCLGLKTPAPKKVKKRYLSEDEILTFWRNLETAPIGEDVRRIFRLVLVTGCRPGEAAGLHGNEIDGDWWTIPEYRSKNGEAHRIFLTNMAHDIIGDCRDSFVFPSPVGKGDKPITAPALPRALRRCEKDDKVLGIPKFTPHDLRRTCGTWLSKLGFMDEIIDACLNHKKKGVIAVYNQNRYDLEKQTAMEAWGRKLTDIVTGQGMSNIVPFSRQA